MSLQSLGSQAISNMTTMTAFGDHFFLCQLTFLKCAWFKQPFLSALYTQYHPSTSISLSFKSRSQKVKTVQKSNNSNSISLSSSPNPNHKKDKIWVLDFAEISQIRIPTLPIRWNPNWECWCWCYCWSQFLLP